MSETVRTTYTAARDAADRFSAHMPELLPNTWPKPVADVLVDIEQFLVGLHVDVGFDGYINSEIGDGVSTMFLLAEVRAAMEAQQ